MGCRHSAPLSPAEGLPKRPVREPQSEQQHSPWQSPDDALHLFLAVKNQLEVAEREQYYVKQSPNLIGQLYCGIRYIVNVLIIFRINVLPFNDVCCKDN